MPELLKQPLVPSETGECVPWEVSDERLMLQEDLRGEAEVRAMLGVST